MEPPTSTEWTNYRRKSRDLKGDVVTRGWLLTVKSWGGRTPCLLVPLGRQIKVVRRDMVKENPEGTPPPRLKVSDSSGPSPVTWRLLSFFSEGDGKGRFHPYICLESLLPTPSPPLNEPHHVFGSFDGPTIILGSKRPTDESPSGSRFPSCT